MVRPDYRLIPATTDGPATLLHLDDPIGPYRGSAPDGRGRSECPAGRKGAASILGGGGGRALDGADGGPMGWP